MGKITKKKYRVHLPLRSHDPRPSVPANFPIKSLFQQNSLHQVQPVLKKCVKFKINPAPKRNLFENIVISPDALKHDLCYSAKDLKNLKDCLAEERAFEAAINAPKYELEARYREKKAKRRKIPFIEVVHSAKEFLKKKEREKEKEKSAILGNFQPMKDALPTLEELIQETKIKNQEDRPRVAKSFSRQDAEMMEDIKTFQQVLNSAEYVADPFNTISAEIQKKLQSGSL